MELLQLFLYWSLAFFTKNLDSLFNTVLGRDGVIFDDVVWCGRFNKVGNLVDDVEIRLCNTVKAMRTNNRVVTTHGAYIGSSIIVFDGGRIP